MNEVEDGQAQECIAAGEEAESELQNDLKGGILDKSKDGIGREPLGGEGKPDRTTRMSE
ncbi:MAG TPA: hypothetical protein VFS76_04655 [Pyrinomonadaceae bacterium]|nr:hypothetical protein [Pyrinomonadaceae bacterium]